MMYPSDLKVLLRSYMEKLCRDGSWFGGFLFFVTRLLLVEKVFVLLVEV